MSRTRYDFTAATDFLNNDVPLSNLYEDVLEAMQTLSMPRRYLLNEDINRVWDTLLTCADFIDTIQIKKKGGRR